MNTNARIVLRYEQGQFSFRALNDNATDTQLYNLAQALNAFQTDEVKKVIKIEQRLISGS